MAIKLIDVDITQPLPTIECTDKYSDIWVFVQNNGKSVGYIYLQGGQWTLTSDHLRQEIDHQLGRQLQLLAVHDKLVNQPTEKRTCDYSPFISVLICTRNRSSQLKYALDSLMNQTYTSFEVLVADNCPTDDSTKKLVAQYPFRYTVEPVPGHSWVRNRAIIESRGEIIAFLDDDMTADKDWLRTTAEGFSEPHIMGVQGIVLPSEIETKAQEIVEVLYGGLRIGFDKKYISNNNSWDFGLNYEAGHYMAFRRELFEKIGMFDVTLGVPVGGAEDIDIMYRAMQGGYSLLYYPDAIRYHKHRESMAELIKQFNGYRKSYTALLTKIYMDHPEIRRKVFLFTMKYFYVWHVKRCIRSFIGRCPVPKKLLAAEAAGALMGPWAYLKSRRAIGKMKNQMSANEHYESEPAYENSRNKSKAA